MRTWWKSDRGRRPSASLVVAFAALMVALGGTAYAAATVVNIADPTTPANVAKVDATGALRTAGTATVSGVLGETVPKVPVWGFRQLSLPNPTFIIGANKATVAITRVTLSNFFLQGGAAHVTLSQEGGDTASCNNVPASWRTVADYEVKPGETFGESFGTPLVLKPQAAGQVWCLVAEIYIENAPSSYYSPQLAWSGYVAAGTLPATAVAAVRSSPQPNLVHQGA